MQVRVVNDNVHVYREKFRGKVIEIGPKASITMDLNDANIFLGTMPPNIEVGADGVQRPESYKMLRIEQGAAPAVEVRKWNCMSCNKDLQTKAAYEEHVAEMHTEQMADEDEKEKVVKKKIGRPRKEVTASDATAD